MFIYSITLTKEKIIALSAILLLLIFLVMFLCQKNQGKGAEIFDIKNTEKSRIEFIEKFGWETDSLYETEQVSIPKEFDTQFLEYETIQNKQKLSLTPYKGKQVTKYTYKVKNYKELDKIVYINIFMYKNKVIACDLICPDLSNGFVTTILKEA